MRVTIIIYPQASFYNYYLYKRSVDTWVAGRGLPRQRRVAEGGEGARPRQHPSLFVSLG